MKLQVYQQWLVSAAAAVLTYSSDSKGSCSARGAQAAAFKLMTMFTVNEPTAS